jgi:hypothetical protein
VFRPRCESFSQTAVAGAPESIYDVIDGVQFDRILYRKSDLDPERVAAFVAAREVSVAPSALSAGGDD